MTRPDPEAVAGTVNRLRKISAALKAVGVTPSDVRIARILGTEPSTVWRWKTGKVVPRGSLALSLAILARLAACQWDVPKGRKKLRAALLERLAQDSGNLHSEFTPFRGYEGALTLLGWNELVPNRCEWDLQGAKIRPVAKKARKK